MHPIEHLRYVARAGGADPAVLAMEAAEALVQMARVQPAGLLPACRRLIERHVLAGPVWWLSARMLRAEDPLDAGRRAVAELENDATASRLADALPDDATVLVVGWPDAAVDALRRRGDAEILVVEHRSEGAQLVRRLEERDFAVQLVPEAGAAAAAVVADLVLVEAVAAGPGGLLAVPGSLAAAAVAAHHGVAVWGVAAVGRILPGPLWDSLLARLDESSEEPWERGAEVVPPELLSQVVGPEGPTDTAEALSASTCPAVAELFRMPG
jgi:hypothetical protein